MNRSEEFWINLSITLCIAVILALIVINVRTCNIHQATEEKKCIIECLKAIKTDERVSDCNRTCNGRMGE